MRNHKAVSDIVSNESHHNCSLKRNIAAFVVIIGLKMGRKKKRREFLHVIFIFCIKMQI